MMKPDKQFLMMAFGFVLLLGILIYNPFQIIVLQTQIKQQNDKIIENSDRNYHATINATKELFNKGNTRGNDTIKYFDSKISQLLKNDQIKFSRLDDITKVIQNDTSQILDQQKDIFGVAIENNIVLSKLYTLLNSSKQ